MELTFGKFHGHTLGQVAAFEPSYVDWLARTVTRDPELVAAARVVQADLDDRRIARRDHVAAAAEVAQPEQTGPDAAIAPRTGRRPMERE